MKEKEKEMSSLLIIVECFYYFAKGIMRMMINISYNFNAFE